MNTIIKQAVRLIVMILISLQLSAEEKAMIDENRPFGGTSIRYISSSAAGMYPTDPGYTYQGNYLSGCRYSNSGLLELVENIDIPDGSRIISVTAMGEDMSSGWFGYTLQVDGQDIANQASSGTLAYNLMTIGEYIDFHMPYFSYQQQKVTMTLSQLGSSIKICGYRIGYLPPDVADDVIFVNNFYR
ncbi:hypothetical protein GCM10011365_00990 [Marinicella pacifica]|jgi:hypothetical protein|uniref:Uncharacterized protein n=1 Tax=Marinicella pacifica TaxID=1171543 RepID=A0A917CEP7_9GAMM|nr:hypothetical protein [Marinicella pacifica]GGF83839.1 hypothetical protein GCM10011365_00990 [Marinicella pacifica]